MMENVIEKHYVPTSGSGLDANLVAALMNNNNKSLDPATVALLRDNDKGLETAALANGGGMFANSKVNDKLYFLNINSITKNPELYIGTILTAGNPIDPPLKPGEFRNPNIPVEKIMSIRVEVFGNVLEYTVPANATSVKDGDTEIYLRRDDLETKLKSQVDSYRIMFESVNKQKQLYEKYNDLFQSVKGNSQENVTEEKYKELIARIAELEEQLKEKEQPKE